MQVYELDLSRHKQAILKDVAAEIERKLIAYPRGDEWEYNRGLRDALEALQIAVYGRIPDTLRVPEITATQIMPDYFEKR